MSNRSSKCRCKICRRKVCKVDAYFEEEQWHVRVGAHRHDGGWVCEDCWDERLRTTS